MVGFNLDPAEGVEGVVPIFGRGETRPSNKRKPCTLFFYFHARLEYK